MQDLVDKICVFRHELSRVEAGLAAEAKTKLLRLRTERAMTAPGDENEDGPEELDEAPLKAFCLDS